MAVSSVKLIVDAANAINPLKRVAKETKKVEEGVRDVNGRLRDAKGRFIGVGTGARGAVKGVNALGVALKAALLPLAGFAVASKFFEGFQEADRAAAAVKTLGVNAKELQKQLEGVARRSDGLASTTQLMAAAYDVASAGFANASDNSKILEASLKGAIGGMSNVATVSDAATSVLNSYGLSADRVGKLIDGFIQTQNDGKIVVEQYAGQIGRLAPIASAAGVGIDELNAAIATTTASGVPVEATFAGLRQGIASILKPSSEAQKLAKELGIEFNATGLKANGFGGLIAEVSRKTAGSTTAMTTLFGSVEAVGAILPIASGNMETFNKNLDNQRTKSGQSADAAKTMGDTVSQSVVKMTNKISDLIRKLDTALGPAISGIITIINGVINAAITAISTLEHMFSLSKDTQIALEVIQSGDLRGGFGRGLSGIDEMIGQDRRQQLQKESGFGGFTNPFSNSNDRDKKFLEALRNEPKIKNLIAGPQKVAGSSKPVTTEDPELAALRARIEALLSGNGNGSSGGNGNGLSGGNAGKSKTEEAEKLLKQQLESGAKLSQQFTRQIELKEASSDLAREELQIEFDRQDALATIAETAEISQIAGLEELANKIAVLDIEKARGDLAAKQASEQEKRDKAAADAAQKRLEADPGFQMQKQFEELIKLENQVAAGATAIGDAFSNAFVGVISGAKSAQEGLAEMMQSVAKHFLDMAAKIIAQQIAMILYGTIMKVLGVSMPGGSGFNPSAPSITGNSLGDFGGGSFGAFAEGGYVTGPTNAVVGEGGEPEYIIPESKMRESMSRYSRGSRGSSVIPAEGGGAAGAEGGVAVAAPIDVRYTVERINSVDYVTADQFQAGMRQATQQGAAQGENRALAKLRNSPGARRRIGL